MNPFDYNLLLYLNHVAHQSPLLTKVIVRFFSNDLKTGLFVALLWWVWFDARDIAHQRVAREKISAGLLGSLVCIVVVRLIAALLPFRPRPLANPLNGLTFPINAGGWDWTSFPSDNAAVFFLLAVCLFSVSRIAGSVALVDAMFFICFPRVFVGVHHPTDIIGGAFIGIAVAYLVTRKRVRVYLSRPMLRWMEAYPPSFYASAFLVTFVFANAFGPAYDVLIGLRKLVRLWIG